MKLSAFLATVYLPSRIEVSPTYAADLAATVRQFSAHLGRDATLADLTEQNVAGYLVVYRTHWSARSTNDKRQSLLCLWRAAFDYLLVPTAPRPRLIRRLPEEHDPPEAWTTEQVGQLIVTAATLQGDPGQLVWPVKKFSGLMPASGSLANSFTGQTSWRGSIFSGNPPF